MMNQFNPEYKALMIDAEKRARQFGHKEILPEDVLTQIAGIKSGNTFDLFTSFGLNEALFLDVLSRPPFASVTPRDGSYIGISDRVKGLIVMSVKIAASFQKSQAGIEDFLLALFRTTTENWFYQVLDFVGISPKDFEMQVVEINTMIASEREPGEVGNVFAPVEDIMSMLEETFSGKKPKTDKKKTTNDQKKEFEDKDVQTPFAQNTPQEKK
jgi:ATP-dependent Clp protease ATP-binding subunit ClpA